MYIYMYIYDICHAHICVICIFYMLCISYIHIFVFNHVILDMHNMCPVRMLHICLYICIYLRLPGQTCVYVYICLHCAHYRWIQDAWYIYTTYMYISTSRYIIQSGPDALSHQQTTHPGEPVDFVCHPPPPHTPTHPRAGTADKQVDTTIGKLAGVSVGTAGTHYCWKGIPGICWHVVGLARQTMLLQVFFWSRHSCDSWMCW